jgi:small redox-active disulfide protein 2
MKINVLGAGCASCKNLFELTKTAVAEMGINAEVAYSDDISKIIELGILQAPVLVVDGKPVMVGGTDDINKLKEIITKSSNTGLTEKK